ncbi:hypothetical protein [Rubrimonas cliftonensis]|uniref:MetA-pathway of phenol degradation n=1 Tax=Rubrimonas cliftonensis TaxID=89524 RepID=A0A1H4G2V1_9RHOB|nr:hypothetical protein [Rubrimonas cliftonensis]SEB03042.1 hypothetical protein SAMN05444370_13311 [Rubrimonas cliftonensis]
MLRLGGLTGAIAACVGGAATAGAWTQPAGAGFSSVGSSYYALRGGGYEELGLTSYIEYGALDWLTLGAVIEASQPIGAAGDQPGDTGAVALARVRLAVGPHGDPFAAQLSVGAPLNDVVNDVAPQRDDDEIETDFRLLYGRGFSSPFGDGWANAEAGVRLRSGINSDEFRLDLTVGVRPTERWLTFVQAFVTRSLGNEDPFGSDYDVLKIAPSAGYRITPELTLVVGTEHEVAGRDITLGDRFRLSIWRSF